MLPVDDAQSSRKYRLIAEIGRGGMADVFLAVAQGPAGFNKLVVLKKARPELAQDPEFLAMFLDEARLSARLNHPNVVQTLEVGHDGERYFIAMEYLDGQPLHRIRSRAGAGGFPVAMQVRVLIDTLNGLHHAHELADFDGTRLEIVHRDATPQNVFVTYDGQIKVVDFGIAKAVDSSSETRTGVVKGKVPYMAPEQARGALVDRRTDIFAVGVMLWEAMSGRRMWKGVTDIAVLTRLAQGEIPRVLDAVKEADPELAAICDKALAPEPDARFASAADFAHQLEEWASHQTTRVAARDVGAFVVARFGEERARIKGLIETQLHDVRWSGSYPRATGRELPKIDPGPILTTPTGSQSNRAATDSVSLLGTGQNATSLTAAAPRSTAEPRPASRLPVAAILGGAGIIASVIVVVGLRFFSPVAAPPSAPVPQGPASEAQAMSAPKATASAIAIAALEPIHIKVRVSPAKAQIFLDDAPMATGSYEGTLPRDGKTHRVRAEAAGFAAKEETITASSDALVAFSLDRETAAPGPATPRDRAVQPTPTPTPVAAPTPTDTTLAPGQKPKRAIDSDSPYAR
jgi:serine/threonine-protein kinase